MDIYFIDRNTKEKKKEIVAGEKLIKWAYESTTGKTLSELVIKRKLFSHIYGKLQDRPKSRQKIESFVKSLEINMSEAVKEKVEDYHCFNDFFIRELKPGMRPISMEPNVLTSPADGRVFGYQNIDAEKVVQVKGLEYSLSELLGDRGLAKRFDGGSYYIIRLCPADYHRFHFCDWGVAGETRKIDGFYYSVNPMALRKIPELYCKNKREVTIFKSQNFGDIAYVEVGAAAVGTIIQTFDEGKSINKGDEKGYFKFGGSTVILFFQKDTVKVDDDIIQNTLDGYETKVNMGEQIGLKY